MFDSWSDKDLFAFVGGIACSLSAGVGAVIGYMMAGNALYLAAVFLAIGFAAQVWFLWRMGTFVADANAQNADAEELDKRLAATSATIERERQRLLALYLDETTDDIRRVLQ